MAFQAVNSYCVRIFASSLTRLTLENPFGCILGSKRYLPKRGTKPLPRYYWDMRDLERITGGQYTHKPLKPNRLGGRHPDTGRKINQHCGGGVKFDYFMIDKNRHGPTTFGEFYEERILEVRRDPTRGPYIALVAGSEGKRWILATDNMEAGQIIKTSKHIPDIAVMAEDGDSYPLGALSAGTEICCIERIPGGGGDFVIGAGASAKVVRHLDKCTVIKTSYNHEIALDKTCMATVGKMSHGDMHSKHYGSANMHRRFGYKQSSGLWHKKDGTAGRKCRRPPQLQFWSSNEAAQPEPYKVTLTRQHLNALFGTAQVHPLVSAGYDNREYND